MHVRVKSHHDPSSCGVGHISTSTLVTCRCGVMSTVAQRDIHPLQHANLEQWTGTPSCCGSKHSSTAAQYTPLTKKPEIVGLSSTTVYRLDPPLYHVHIRIPPTLSVLSSRYPPKHDLGTVHLPTRWPSSQRLHATPSALDLATAANTLRNAEIDPNTWVQKASPLTPQPSGPQKERSTNMGLEPTTFRLIHE